MHLPIALIALLTLRLRHRRTHEARPDGETGYIDDDIEAEENEFGTLDEESESPDGSTSYMPHSMNTMHTNHMRMPSNDMGHQGLGMNDAMGPPMMTHQMPVSQQM